MNFGILKKSICAVLASAMLSVPSYAIEQQGMITTAVIVAQMDRAEAQRRIDEFVDRADIQKMFLDRGLAPDEVKSRLASLTEDELRSLAKQIEKAKAGADVAIGGVLVLILLVVLIIFLIKRI